MKEALPWKSLVDIKDHYNILIEDIDVIESGRVPLPDYPEEPRDSNQDSEASIGWRRGAFWSKEEHRILLSQNNIKSPYELMFGEKPSIKSLRVLDLSVVFISRILSRENWIVRHENVYLLDMMKGKKHEERLFLYQIRRQNIKHRLLLLKNVYGSKEFLKNVYGSKDLLKYSNYLYQSSTENANNPVFHVRTQHVELEYPFIQEKVLDGTINTLKVRSQENIAAILT
ncbi:hypothetical protein FXO38_05309 [Capsicum annuum]|nr:hypothetical protein FXO37_13938 [Capsicum annuum]KAF3674266.1 hypothetical protein FXO38_05309 [Capsicum annuum]